MNALLDLFFAVVLGCLSSLGVYDGYKTEKHYSTIFAQKGDKWAGGKSKCLGRQVLPTDNVIAHRKWRCGTWVLLYNPRTERETIARIGDHGPYGACIKEGWVVGMPCPKEYWRVKRKREDPGVWKGAFDLTDHVAENLGHNGFEPITLRVIHKPRRKL